MSGARFGHIHIIGDPSEAVDAAITEYRRLTPFATGDTLCVGGLTPRADPTPALSYG